MIQHEFITLTLAQFGQFLKIPYNGQSVFTNEWDLASLEYSQETEGPYYTDLPTLDDIRRLLELERVMVDRTIKSQTVTLTPNQILTKELSPDMKQWEELIQENEQYNLAYFFVKRIECARANPTANLPYEPLRASGKKNSIRSDPKISHTEIPKMTSSDENTPDMMSICYTAILTITIDTESNHSPSYLYCLQDTPGNREASSSHGSVVDDVIHSFLAESEPKQQLVYEDLKQIEKLDLEELDLKCRVAILTIRVQSLRKGRKKRLKVSMDRKQLGLTRRAKASQDNQRYSAYKTQNARKKTDDSQALISVDTLNNCKIIKDAHTDEVCLETDTQEQRKMPIIRIRFHSKDPLGHEPKPVMAWGPMVVLECMTGKQEHRNMDSSTETECPVLTNTTSYLDESSSTDLKVPRKHNLYTIKFILTCTSGDLACLLAKATLDESTQWHRRLGHVNFNNMNKLVKG
ncbi:pentatricopeptide repeat-containing protein [Tanacetum coccineum]|uniref:Pentatricopeptide repeat-containing protein n=1 Tax=Tanacetum coccineum TaxID=301880 RepID=A0ABQ5HAT7_9ASTR